MIRGFLIVNHSYTPQCTDKGTKRSRERERETTTSVGGNETIAYIHTHTHTNNVGCVIGAFPPHSPSASPPTRRQPASTAMGGGKTAGKRKRETARHDGRKPLRHQKRESPRVNKKKRKKKRKRTKEHKRQKKKEKGRSGEQERERERQKVSPPPPPLCHHRLPSFCGIRLKTLQQLHTTQLRKKKGKTERKRKHSANT